MSDDLVKLARWCANGVGSPKTAKGDFGLFDDLADRIKALQAERDLLKSVLDGAEYRIDMDWLREHGEEGAHALGAEAARVTKGFIARMEAAEAKRDAAVLAERDMLEALAGVQNGARPLQIDRELLGRFVRESWVRWAKTQENPKPSWLVPYDELQECDKEADRRIGEDIARWTLIYDAAAFSAAIRARSNKEPEQ